MYSQIRNISIACIIFVALGGVFQTATADIEANKQLVLRHMELWDTGNLAIADEIFATDYINHDPTLPDVTDIEGLKGFVVVSRIAFPDFHHTSEDMVAEGDKVARRVTITATHQGEFMGIPATGRQVTWTGIIISRIADGKIVEEWWNYDALALMQQLGMMPPTRETYTWGVPLEVTGDPGDPETNKAIVQRMIDEVMNQQNLAVIDELFASDYLMHDPAWPMEVKGPEGFKQWAGAMFEPYFSDSHIAAEDIFAEGDKVVVRWTWSGTHTGEFMGIPPTGRPIAITGTSIHRFADGKFVESWVSYNSLGMIQQLTTPEWPVAGAWINIVPISGLGDIVGVLTVSPQDYSGANFTSVLRAGKPEATVFGAFPDADHQSDHIGQIVKLGLNTYESTAIGYGTKKSELPGMLPEIVYISVLSAKMQLIDENTMEGEGTHAFFAPFQDADGNGLPDEGQEPVACFPYTITSKRVQLIPPCVPPPPEPEGE
jgi:steroid delta-isomerase-like uncharacterized protein